MQTPHHKACIMQLQDNALQLQMGEGGGGGDASSERGGGEGAGEGVDCSCTPALLRCRCCQPHHQPSAAAATQSSPRVAMMHTLRVIVIARAAFTPATAGATPATAGGVLRHVTDGLMHSLQPRTRMLVEIIPLTLPNAVVDADTFVAQASARAAAAVVTSSSSSSSHSPPLPLPPAVLQQHIARAHHTPVPGRGAGCG